MTPEEAEAIVSEMMLPGHGGNERPLINRMPHAGDNDIHINGFVTVNQMLALILLMCPIQATGD